MIDNLVSNERFEGISPVCVMCSRILTEYGGILFSPPKSSAFGLETVEKRHLCAKCHQRVVEYIIQNKEES